jgi:hypothetical protein
MIPAFVTLEDAKRHLHIAPENTRYDADIQQKADEATAHLMDWGGQKDIPPHWYVGSPPVLEIPLIAVSATKIMLGELYEHREAQVNDLFSPAMQRILQRLFDPVLG